MFPNLRLAVAACTIFTLAVPAAAEDASRWDGDARSAIRLIAGSRSGDIVRAGVEIRLKPGWHTYWRYPGDAGVPPRFDFEGSQNIKSVDVRWPAPKRLPEAGMTAIGYDRDVILPLVIVPQDPGKPVVLRLKLDYAVCEKLCVPADGKAELALARRSSASEPLVTAEARVPKKVKLGEGASFAIRSVKRDGGPDQPRIIVDVAAPDGIAVDLFAEGPTPEWALPVPNETGGAASGLRRFTFALDGAPPGAQYQGAPVTLTAVAGNDAIEVTIRLD
jgi:DsbC/DsbD-like thiol-disulfide interchange protein